MFSETNTYLYYLESRSDGIGSSCCEAVEPLDLYRDIMDIFL